VSKPGKQTSKASKPRLTIESQDETKAGAPASQAANGSEPVDDEIDFHEAAGFIRGLGMLMWRYARSHPHTVLYGFIGFVLAALILILGLWNTIVIAVFVFVGAILGQVRDGDNAIVNFFGKLFDRH
jgi:uncharacterized membrane protein